MEKRRYTKIQELLPIIQAMQEAWKSHKEIEEELGLSGEWVTDISYIYTGQGVLYLSMIRDLYDNSIVAYKTAVQPGSGYDPPCYEDRKNVRWEIAAPQRPRVPVHFSGIL